MDDIQDRASRGIALAALTVACVLFGPTPQVVRAMERIYAVQVDEEERHRGRHRRTRRPQRRPGPPGRRPAPSRPAPSHP